MPERKAFSIEKPPVSGEVRGNTESRKIVVFSHGFGVQRDSRGMFTELAQRLEDNHLVVLFDYVDVDEEGNTTAHPLTEQSEMLNAVLRYIRETYLSEDIAIIAHSQGCLVVSLSNPDGINRVVLNAPPMSAPNITRMQKTFGSREGTHIVADGISTIARSDGTKTHIPPIFWEVTAGIEPGELYADLADQTEIYVVIANQDHVLHGQDYSAVSQNPNTTVIELDGNHDFAGDAREGWLDMMVQLIDGKE
jgi:hypothetical protein